MTGTRPVCPQPIRLRAFLHLAPTARTNAHFPAFPLPRAGKYTKIIVNRSPRPAGSSGRDIFDCEVTAMLSEKDLELAKSSYTFWDRLTLEQQEYLTQNLYPVHYSEGDIIHNGEYSCIGVVLIKTGGLRVFLLSSEGKEITLYRLGPQEICVLSASCILDNITFDVCVEAEKDTEALLIPSSQYQKLMNQNIYAQNFTYALVIDRFSNVMWAMEQLLFMRFDKRLAIFLLDELSKTGNPRIQLTHEHIAKYMGSAREVVSRMLKYFANEGMIEMSRGGITIIDKEKLRALTV